MAEAVLELDITQALDAIGDVNSAFDAVAADFGTSLAASFQESLNVVGEISSALDDAAANFGDTLSSADAGGGEGISGVTSSLKELGTTAIGAGEGLDLADGAAKGLDATSGVLRGSMAGLITTVAPQAAIFAAVTAAVIGLVEMGDKAQLSVERMNTVFGSEAPAVLGTKIKSLGLSLAELDTRTGTADTKMRMALATFGQTAIGAGATQTQAANVAREMGALTQIVTTLNPALGTADQNFQMITRGLGGSTRILQRYGITIDAAKQSALALSLAQAAGREKASLYDKQVAGLTLSMQALKDQSVAAGTTLKGRLGEALDSSTVRFNALKGSISTALENIGVPLVHAGLQIAEALTPIATTIISAFGEVAKVVEHDVLPPVQLFADIMTEAVFPAIQKVVSALGFLEPLIGPIVLGFLAFKSVSLVLDLVEGSIGLVAKGMLALATSVDGMGATKAATSLLSLATGAEAASVGVAGAAASVSAIAVPLAVAAVATAAVTVGLFALDGGLQQAGDHIGDLASKSLPQLTKAFHDQYEAQVRASQYNTNQAVTAEDKLAGKQWNSFAALDAFNKVLKDTPDQAQKYIQAAQASADKGELFGRVVSKMRTELEQTNVVQAKAAIAAQQHKDAVTALVDTMIPANKLETDAATALAAFAAGTGSAAAAVKALSAAEGDLKTQMDLLLGNFVSQDQAQATFVKAMEDIDQTLADNHDSFDILFQDGRNNRTALDGLATAAETTSSAIFKATGSVTQAQVPLTQLRDKLIAIQSGMKAAGEDTSFVDGLLVHVNAAIAGVTAKVPDAVDSGKKVGKGIADGIDAEKPKSKQAGENHVAAAVSGVIQHQKDVEKAASDAAAAGVAALMATEPDFFGAGMALSAAQADGYTGNKKKNEDAASGVAQAALDALNAKDPQFQSIGNALAEAAAGGISESAWEAAANAGALGQGAATAMNSAAAAARTAGQNLGQGFAIGIADFNDPVYQAALQLANQGALGLKDGIESKSPSKLTRREAGIPFGQGFALGILDTVGLVKTAANSLVEGAMSGARKSNAPQLMFDMASRNTGTQTSSGGGMPGQVVHDKSIHIDKVELHGKTTSPVEHTNELADEFRTAAYLAGVG